MFRRRLKISVYPTKKGRDEIDENHGLYGRHYIKDKPVDRLENDEYMQYIRVRTKTCKAIILLFFRLKTMA